MTMQAADEIRTQLEERLETLVRRLELDQGRGLFRSFESFTPISGRFVARQAFKTIGAKYLFGFVSSDGAGGERFTPILCLCTAVDEKEAKAIHRLIWSQGAIPLMLIALPDGFQVRHGLKPPPPQGSTVSWSALEEGLPFPRDLNSLHAVSLRSSIVWKDFAINRREKVDQALLSSITALSAEIRQCEPNCPRSVIHASIGRFLYLYVLLDRGVVGSGWIKEISISGRSCATIAEDIELSVGNLTWPKMEIWDLFDSVDQIMNGAIFPVKPAERELISEKSLNLIHDVIRHGHELSDRTIQLSFLDVKFSTLRTETISAIYELFLALESDDTRTDDGAFYTPPFLVDYVLDEVDQISAFNETSVVLDPAAGSGIFLVGAFRRMLERTLPVGQWQSEELKAAKSLLENRIFGIERNSQAANVCRFSLYVTLLDYLDGVDIVTLSEIAGGSPVFPSLSDNIVNTDVFTFDAKAAGRAHAFTHVVGNPPWGSFGDAASRTNEAPDEERQKKIEASLAPAIAYAGTLDQQKFPVANKRLSELFIWKISQDLLAPSGTLGILISTKSFVSRSAGAFPRALASRLKLRGLANFSHFRYRLFSAARSPTIAIFATNDEPDTMDEVWVYSPLLSSQPIGQSGHLWSIIAHESDIERHRLRDLVGSPDGWFDHLVLRALDRKFARHIRLWTKKRSGSLGDVLSQNGMRMSRGGSPRQTGLPKKLLLGADYRKVLGLEDTLSTPNYPFAELSNRAVNKAFEYIFAGSVLLIPRNMNSFDFVAQPVAFSSTINAIFFHGNHNPPSEFDQVFLRAIGKYLASHVAKYFYALTGRSWILEHARLEKGDLLRVPFPFEDEDIPGLLVGSQSEITQTVARRMGLRGEFVKAVDEYTRFRNGFEDAQLPQGSLARPNTDRMDDYKEMLETQLNRSFSSDMTWKVGIESSVEERGSANILITYHHKRSPVVADVYSPSAGIRSSGEFNPVASVHFDPMLNLVSIAKPLTNVAWTLEQAFADARSVTIAMMHGGASH